MRRSTERILTTHTGSLPRPDDLVQLMFDKEDGREVDQDRLDERVRSATAEIVRQQVQVGVDVVSDGEVGKPAYATYMKDRLTGFDGEGSLPTARRIRRLSGVFQPAARGPGYQTPEDADLHRPGHAQGPGCGPARHRQLQGGARRPRLGETG